ncbi:MAG: aldo/keto reductase [Gammaproteobacteria bacterium]|nr:aldo/keto reductase [Gammaproteobacteria bacterium]
MTSDRLHGKIARRKFIQYLAMLGVGSQALLRSGSLRAAVLEAQESAGVGSAWPPMAYRTLGRTGYEASRLIFGCGAALMSGRNDALLNAAFDAGVNIFDSGTSRYYDDAERNLAPFLKTHRDDIFLISKAMVYLDVEPDEAVTVAQAREAAQTWTGLMDQSLQELEVDHVDAYYLMGSNNPSVIASEEIHNAFQRAKQAGKVRFLGLSTHQNAQKVLETAIETGWYDLAMLAITPGGWYDWKDRSILPESPPMVELQPLLASAREAGIGLVGMKAGRFLAGRRFLGWGNPEAFDEYYDDTLLKARLSEFQRSYAFVLEHGMDVVNADMQNFVHLKENFVAAATSGQYFVA